MFVQTNSMGRSFFLFILLLHLIVSEKNDFLCKNCGKAISSIESIIEKEAEDSEGTEYMDPDSEMESVQYDVFPKMVSGCALKHKN